ncbi:MAG: TlpA family protein disulfide reductase [Bacteroidales bacterium]|nr:TlpA family protein disulfide reductase [Bacteroidales bacterium]
MRKIFILFIAILALNQLYAQRGNTLPDVEIKTMQGETVSTSEITNDGDPMIISFWALWCKPCIKELDAISEVYDDWQEETGLKVVAVSIDDARSTSRVKPTVNGKGWDYEVYLDPNGEFKRAMNVNMIPHVFLLNGDREIIYQHTSYTEGSEYELYEKVLKLKEGKSLDD